MEVNGEDIRPTSRSFLHEGENANQVAADGVRGRSGAIANYAQLWFQAEDATP